ncbi:hypothetical protein BPA30113_05725 [Burkholderia paludis]|uniref:Uncharacterized protein n=1 Tax=Burkholderia paludis TaxID=1506587 RepID=A0A6J5EKH8_9BURK|nr:hypothetical protein LMG30113_05038 [Burkholderia paludis]VWC20817.1 hypothetical protein BPA30113_05725 [Burkholderia paludis]
MATSQPAPPARRPVRDTRGGMAWGEKLHSPAVLFVRALAQAERPNGPGNWSLVERTGNDKSCPVNFPIDSRAACKRSSRAANFLISLEVSGAPQHRRRHSATYTWVPAAATVSAISGGSGLSVNSACTWLRCPWRTSAGRPTFEWSVTR